jgi:SAM-dependent methyltransferase
MADRLTPRSLLRLSFETQEEYRAYFRQAGHIYGQIWFWHETLGNRAEPLPLPGICDVCERATIFTATPKKSESTDPFDYRVPWWSGTPCGCNMTTLDRAVLRALLDGGSRQDRVYHVGHQSRLRAWLADRLPNVVSTEYAMTRRPGEVENGIRYEDLTGLTFSDGEFDCIICLEILEHVFDYRAALREMARTLKPGGRALLSFPWLGGEHYEHQTRAELLPDGTVRHILPPEYHGDPTTKDGILSFRNFGWKILDEIRDCGFARASAQFIFGPLYGYLTTLTPVIVAIR